MKTNTHGVWHQLATHEVRQADAVAVALEVALLRWFDNYTRRAIRAALLPTSATPILVVKSDPKSEADLVKLIHIYSVRHAKAVAAARGNLLGLLDKQIAVIVRDAGNVYWRNKVIKVRGITATLDRTIRDAIVKARKDRPISIQAVARKVFNEVHDISVKRAALIARTEVAQANNFYSHMIHVAVGVQQLEWITQLDKHVRDSHVMMHGIVVGPPKMFELPSGVRMRYPADSEAVGDSDAIMRELINCRCVAVPHQT